MSPGDLKSYVRMKPLEKAGNPHSDLAIPQIFCAKCRQHKAYPNRPRLRFSGSEAVTLLDEVYSDAMDGYSKPQPLQCTYFKLHVVVVASPRDLSFAAQEEIVQ